MKVDLTDEEWELLKRTVETALRELRSEIHHTHDFEPRSQLIHREATLRHILDALLTPVPAATNV
jgi:hypothetical protein